MAEHENIRQLISVYFDGEASPEEQRQVKEHIQDCDACRKYFNELKKLSNSLQSWTEESLSPDLMHNINKKMQEGREMKTKTILIPVTSSVVVGLLVFVVATHVYIKRGIQGRLRSAADDVGEQYSVGKGDITTAYPSKSQPGVTWQDVAVVPQETVTQTVTQGRGDQYEPYYLKSEYAAKEVTSVDEKPVTRSRPLSGAVMYGQGTDKDASVMMRTKEVTNGPAIIMMGMAPHVLGDGKVAADYEGRGYGGKGVISPEIEYWAEEQERGQWNTEQYDRIYENEFLEVTENPLSTFSIDVDTASYSNVRRFLNNNQLPPLDAVRIEEMVNYFVYDYPQPRGEDPFSINTEVAPAPWNQAHQLVMIGLQGKNLSAQETPPSNLVFLIDVSGSMKSANKLPLLKQAFRMLVSQLRPNEKISIVTYAGSAGLVLDSAGGGEKQKILNALDRLSAGGSTAGGAGIKLAYKVAKQNYIPGGNNRVILATDGDFNIGVSSDAEMVRLIEEKRKDGIFLTTLGFGMGNYKDSRLEKIADKGNGNYYYIDNLQEAKKVMVYELGSMLFTIAKDVKLQIEFNPNQVKAYRLLGYENRILAKEDFNDDTKDAGELGAGHTVTAFYEIVPAGSSEQFRTVDPLKYQKSVVQPSNDLLTVNLRYKKPDEDTSKLISRSLSQDEIIRIESTSDNFRWASAVVEFGLLLRDSKYKAGASYRHLLDQARQARGKDHWGYRQEFIQLVEKAGLLGLSSRSR